MTMKDAILSAYSNDLANREFENNQSPRLNGQGFSADSNQTRLSFTEFLDSYFGSRLNQPIQDFPSKEEFDFELEHAGNVLYDNVIE